jgi:hypothetical protein
MNNGPPLVFERQVLSLALMEKELYQLYTNVSAKVEDLSAKALFSYIATDSLKHSTILASIIDSVDGSRAKERDCDENILYHKKLIKSIARDLARAQFVDREGLLALLESLAGFENLLLSEYKKAFHLDFAVAPKQYGLNNDTEPDMNIFTLIVGDEERHQQILATITQLCDRQLTFKSNAPVVKYQSPDSWYVPPRRSRR